MHTDMKLDAVSFSRGGKAVLSAIDLKIEKGEILGLIGPNGAGKTTLMKLMIRALLPSGGRISLDGKAIGDWPQKALARRVAYLPQGPVLDSPFTCEEVVLMGRYAHRGRFDPFSAADAAIVHKAMRQTETETLAERLITELSGGELQRVLLARALAQEADFLLLDEPTANLHPHYQLGLLDLVSALADAGSGVVLALQDLNLAARYCRRLALLHEGKIIALGPPEAVLTRDNLRKAYGIETALSRHPTTGQLWIVPIGISEGRRTMDDENKEALSGHA